MSDESESYFRISSNPAASSVAPREGAAWMGPHADFPLYTLAEGLTFRPVFGERLLLNFATFGPDRGFPTHTHAEEQMGIVLEGEMDITIGDETRLLKKGDIYIFPSNVPHSGQAHESACLCLDIFAPPRAGFRELIARATKLRSPTNWWEPGEPE